MYSKNKSITDRYMTLTPPPGYDGSRFRRRSDGRDDTFPLYGEREITDTRPHHNGRLYKNKGYPAKEAEEQLQESTDDICECEADLTSTDEDNEPIRSDEKEKDPFSFLKSIGSEEILLIALIVLLAGDQSRQGMETVLILALLLCVF